MGRYMAFKKIVNFITYFAICAVMSDITITFCLAATPSYVINRINPYFIWEVWSVSILTGLVVYGVISLIIKSIRKFQAKKLRFSTH
jgi:hypothetical protein